MPDIVLLSHTAHDLAGLKPIAVKSCTASTNQDGYSCTKAFDGTTGSGNGWAVGGGASAATPSWLQLTLGAASPVAGLNIIQEFGADHHMTNFKVELVTLAGLRPGLDILCLVFSWVASRADMLYFNSGAYS